MTAGAEMSPRKICLPTAKVDRILEGQTALMWPLPRIMDIVKELRHTAQFKAFCDEILGTSRTRDLVKSVAAWPSKPCCLPRVKAAPHASILRQRAQRRCRNLTTSCAADQALITVAHAADVIQAPDLNLGIARPDPVAASCPRAVVEQASPRTS